MSGFPDPLANPFGQPQQQPNDFLQAVNFLSQSIGQAVQLGAQAGANTGPSLRDLPKSDVKLPKFAGEVTGKDRARPSHVLNFLHKVNAYFTFYSGVLTDEDLKLNLLLNCFEGNAKACVWFNAQRPHFTTVTEFRDAFVDYYGGTAADERALRSRLFAFRQRECDTVKEYYSAFLDLVADIHALVEFVHGGDEAYKLDDSFQADKFVQGLHPSIRSDVERVLIRNPDLSLHDAMNEAYLEEKVYRQKNPRDRRKPDPVKPRFNGVDGGSSPYKDGCFYCKSMSHKAADCRKIAAKKAAGKWRERGSEKSK